MIKVGLIGAGTMGRVHGSALRRLQNAQLKAVCDLRLEKAQQVAGPEVQAVTDYQAILDDPEIDVVDVCLPTHLHKEVVAAAARAGKHVFCEKPIALNLKDAQEMIDACKKAGVKLGIGHVVRFFPDYYRVKDVLASGRIGEPKAVRTFHGGSFPSWSDDNWYADYSKSGGPIVDLIIHDFDFLLWLFGPVSRVFAKSVKGQKNLDHALVTLRFASGLIAHVEGTWAQPKGTPFSSSYEIAGTKGLYEYSKDRSVAVLLRTAQGDNQAQFYPESPLALEPYTAQLKAFFDAVAADEEVPVSAEDAVRALEVALAAYRSAQSGEVVWLGGEQNG